MYTVPDLFWGQSLTILTVPKFHPKYPPDQNNSYAIKHIFIKIAFGQKLWGVSETQRVCGGLNPLIQVRY